VAADLQGELEAAERLARQAAALISGYVGSGIGVEYKPGDGSPVTRADTEANHLIVEGLRRAFPGDAVLSEEAPDDGAWLRAERVWMVDPIDGTADFIRGRAGFAVMIGLVVAGEPQVGVVMQPVTGRLLRARAGGPAERLDAEGRVEVLHVSTVSDLTSIRLVASASHRSEAIDRVRAALGVTSELNVGSVGLKLGLIASGERDLYVNPASKSSLWDCAGPQVILTAAGGRLSDLAGAPIVYTTPDVRTRRGLIASNGLVHPAVLEKLAALFPDGTPES